MKPRFFFDETDLLLAKKMSKAAPGEVVFPGHANFPEVARGSLDSHWLPIVGERGLVVITRDKAIRRKPVERQIWVEHALRGFVLTGRDSQTTETSLSLITKNWRKIDEVVAERQIGPWMIALNSAGLREIDLT